MDKKPATRVSHVYYITAIENLPSILEHGVLCHSEAEKLPIYKKIYNKKIVASRKNRTAGGVSLWDFANFYFNPRNPMLYQVHKYGDSEVAILKMKSGVIREGKFVAIGNAAASLSKILPLAEGMKQVQSEDIKKYLFAEGWGEGEGKRLIMSELLVPKKASPLLIDTIYLPSEAKCREVGALTGGRVHVVPEPHLFFENSDAVSLNGTKIKLIKGDMFFSRLQTLVISVNTVGVMGGGLAARAKENFPRLYVEFQKFCKSGRLTTKTPILYKEPFSYDELFVDNPESLKGRVNDLKLFLLFATKENWRFPSKMEYIQDGLAWLVANAKKESIESLAMPALGCGLGGLPWERVGPLMCQALQKLDMECEIYLPREGKEIPKAQLSADFLLAKN